MELDETFCLVSSRKDLGLHEDESDGATSAQAESGEDNDVQQNNCGNTNPDQPANNWENKHLKWFKILPAFVFVVEKVTKKASAQQDIAQRSAFEESADFAKNRSSSRWRRSSNDDVSGRDQQKNMKRLHGVCLSRQPSGCFVNTVKSLYTHFDTLTVEDHCPQMSRCSCFERFWVSEFWFSHAFFEKSGLLYDQKTASVQMFLFVGHYCIIFSIFTHIPCKLQTFVMMRNQCIWIWLW